MKNKIYVKNEETKFNKINFLKEQVDRKWLLEEVKECTFKPKLYKRINT